MPIVIEPIKHATLKELLDQLGLTLIIREDNEGEWNAYMRVPNMEDEFDLFEEWSVQCEDSPREVAEGVAEALSYDALELGSLTIDCKGMLIEVGNDFPS